ncbi:MAG: nicotinate-nucleotide adenylyltransferase [Candidatus Anoxychlamydiales bacterium]|nr:nicotinate-nucleotide adenylyltransferase [Candidatus Anoxychlamydiales bacterium]
MRNCFSVFAFLFFGVGMLFFPNFLKASILDENFDLENLKGKKLGYYIGSFDPIHLGHQHVIETALHEKYVDYILIYPAPDGDSFKNRNELSIRQKMIASIYKDNPKVLITYWLPKELQDKFSLIVDDVKVIGIIGSDVILERLVGPDKVLSEKYQKVFMRGMPLPEKHYKDTVGGLMALKADAFIVALLGDIDLTYLNGKINDRFIRGFIQSKEISSTRVRNAINEQRAFEEFLAFEVQAIIKQEGLYGFSSNFNIKLQKELLDMFNKDQEARMSIVSIKNPSEEEWKVIAEIDTKNSQRLKEIVNQYGWPGVSLVGLEGTSAMWLLIQHQDNDLDFQKDCLELLKVAVKAKEASMQSFAYLVDRVNMNKKLPQVYGTQWIQEDGKFIMYSVEDIDNLDLHRIEVGLCSISDYKEQIKEAYHLTDKDFK